MTETTTDLAEDADLEITELVDFDPTRIDGVKAAATGIPFLVMKSVAKSEAEPNGQHGAKSTEPGMALAEAIKAVVRGKVDEGPDVDLGKQIMALLGQAIGNEAQEIAAGFHGEICDVSLLSQAAELVKCWTSGEQTATIDGASTKAAMSSADQNDLPDSAFAYIEDGGSKDASGKTTPRSLRHFPVHDKAHAQNALARLSSSPFGGKAKAKVHAAARKFGIDVSDDSSSSKSTDVAEGGTDVHTEAQGTGALTKSDLDAAIAKAIEPLKAENATLREDLAKVKATPVPGGPVLSANARPHGGAQTQEAEDLAAKAALYRAKADACVSPQDRDGYRQLAREFDDKAAKAAQLTS